MAPDSDKWLSRVSRIVMEYHPRFYNEEVRLSMVSKLESVGFNVFTTPESNMMFAKKCEHHLNIKNTSRPESNDVSSK
jgi:hypothetical protein